MHEKKVLSKKKKLEKEHVRRKELAMLELTNETRCSTFEVEAKTHKQSSLLSMNKSFTEQYQDKLMKWRKARKSCPAGNCEAMPKVQREVDRAMQARFVKEQAMRRQYYNELRTSRKSVFWS